MKFIRVKVYGLLVEYETYINISQIVEIDLDVIKLSDGRKLKLSQNSIRDINRLIERY